MITVKNLQKFYKLYKSPLDRIKESLSLSKKKYHKIFLANNNISFSIKKGEVVGIIGKNGSGKSTLLKILSGVLTPSSGYVKLNGKVTAMLELSSGFNNDLTGIENLYLNGSINGISKDIIDSKIDDIIKFADIGEFIHQPVKTYSSGMKARLGFSFSIHIEPEILIIDEALSVGDVAFARKCYARIEEMCENKEVTVLLVTHSENVIVSLCTRALLIHSGELLLDGNPKDVVSQYLKMSKTNDIDVDKVKKDFLNIKNEQTIVPKDSSMYSPNLISKSVVELDKNGAYISDVQILNIDNKKVNILEYNKKYFFSYKITFTQNMKNISCGMFIKNKDGIRFGGQESSVDNTNKEYKSGTSLIIRWTFDNILTNGYYFINCGIVSNEFEKIVLHRLYDAYLFQVRSSEDTDITGDIDFKLELKTMEVL